MMGASFAVVYTTVGGISYPWLQAMATQFGSCCISLCIDLRYRSLYKKQMLKRALAAAAAVEHKAASTLEGLAAEGAAASISQVDVQQLCPA